MARPRTTSDDDILTAARRCVLEQGPSVTLSAIGRRVGLTAAGLLKRFGSKEQLLFRALLPSGPPAWIRMLSTAPGADPERQLVQVLTQMAREFEAVGPALAALRMSKHAVQAVFPEDRAGPSVIARRMLADWLTLAGAEGDVSALADAAIGAAEARGFLAWIGPQMVGSEDHEAWATDLARLVMERRSRCASPCS